MASEIEWKFLVDGDSWRQGAPGTLIRQGYLSTHPEREVRVRLAGDEATLTVKGARQGRTRPEFEYRIPAAEAAEILERLCPAPLIEKLRHQVPHGGCIWEVDEFLGENEGLVVAEVELTSEEEEIDLPGWVGEEVTGDPRYSNAGLSQKPFVRW